MQVSKNSYFVEGLSQLFFEKSFGIVALLLSKYLESFVLQFLYKELDFRGLVYLASTLDFTLSLIFMLFVLSCLVDKILVNLLENLGDKEY